MRMRRELLVLVVTVVAIVGGASLALFIRGLSLPGGSGSTMDGRRVATVAPAPGEEGGTDSKLLCDLPRGADLGGTRGTSPGRAPSPGTGKGQVEALLESIAGMRTGTWERSQAIARLRELSPQGEKDYSLLISCLDGQDVELCRAVIRLLCERGYTGANEKLVELVWRMPHRDMLGQSVGRVEYLIGMEAVSALAKLGDESAIPVIVQAIAQGKGYGTDISVALARFGEPALSEILRAVVGLEYGGRERKNLVQAISAIRDEKAVEELRVLVATAGSADVFVAASQALLAMKGKPDMEASLGQAAGSDAEARAQAARNLAGVGDERAFGALAGLLSSDESEFVRFEAARALASSPNSGAVGVLLRALDEEATEKVRRAIVISFGEARVEGALDVLGKMLGDEEEPVSIRMDCASALFKITGDGRYVEAHNELSKKMAAEKVELRTATDE